MADDPDQQRVIRVTRNGGAGHSYGQLRSARYVSPARGVRIDVTAPDGPLDDLDVAVAGTVPRAVITDVAAARAWDLPVPPWLHDGGDRPVSMAVPAGTAEPQRPGVRGRRLLLPEDHVTVLDGRPVTTPARTWLDCAAEVPLEYVVAMGDAALRRELVQMEELRAMLHWAFRRRGVGVARRAFPLLDAASASPGESLVRVHLNLSGLPWPECNVDLIDRGEWLARGDLVWRKYRVVVEYDGLVHLEESQRRRDAQRRNLLQEHGWLVITATAADLRHPWRLCDLVRRALIDRGWDPASRRTPR